MECFEKSIEFNPENDFCYNAIAYILEEQHEICKLKHEDVEYYLKKAVELNPENHSALNNLGVYLKNKGLYEEAEFHYQQSIEKYPDEISYNNFGLLLDLQDKFEEAEIYFRKSLRVNPNYKNAQTNLSRLLFSQGKIEESVKWKRRENVATIIS